MPGGRRLRPVQARRSPQGGQRAPRWRSCRDLLESRDPSRQRGREAGQTARARGCVSVCVCERKQCVRADSGGRAHACACLRANTSGVCAGACVGTRVRWLRLCLYESECEYVWVGGRVSVWVGGCVGACVGCVCVCVCVCGCVGD